MRERVYSSHSVGLSVYLLTEALKDRCITTVDTGTNMKKIMI